MKKEKRPPTRYVLPVPRSKEQAEHLYDSISRFYDLLTWIFERKYTNMTLNRLAIRKGEVILEIGFGPGRCLQHIARSVGKSGKAYGIDISSRMLEVAKRRLTKAKLMDRVELYRGDAAKLPYSNNAFDAAFMSFTLELFDTPEIPGVLEEIKRVLKPGGRLGVASMSRENGKSLLLKLYEWIHKKWPKYVDCRPIYLEQSLRESGYQIQNKERVKIFGLPGDIIVAIKGSLAATTSLAV